VASQTYLSNDGVVRRALQTDGLVCIAAGAVFTLGAGAISTLAGVEPPELTLFFGLFLLVYGVILYALASRTPLDRRLLIIIIGLNAVSAVLSLLFLIADPLTFTTAGKWITFMLADVVTVLGIWQFIGLRRMR
jgi:hypothetical protein